jgi:Fe2+ or Zn2+ uptake regulation protein
MEENICKSRDVQHGYFRCDLCREEFMIGDGSDLNVCFNHMLFLCDACYDVHEHKVKQINREIKERHK